MLQSSRLLLLHNIPFIEKHFYNVQVNAMWKVFRFASLPSITSYIRYYRKRKYMYVSVICTHECLCACWSHIILFHYLLHQNVNTDIVLLRKKTYYYKTVVEARQHPSFLLHRAFSDVLYCKTVLFWVTHSLFFPTLFGFISHDVSRLQKGYREQSLLMHA